MGFLDALVQSSLRFRGDLLPTGYTERGATWVINIGSEKGTQPTVVKKGKGELTLKSPTTPADRALGKVARPCWSTKSRMQLACLTAARRVIGQDRT